MTAYAYLRKSSVRDMARDVSHEVQEDAVRALADAHGDNHGQLVTLSDWDISGRLGADKRPGYRALLDAIESGRATAVYSYSLSRLGRSLPELARLIANCDTRGIPVRLHADHVDTSTASGRLLTHILASVAAFEADVASERTRAAHAAKLARGEKLGTVHSFGEKPGEDADAVLAAFAEAKSYSGAARLLNERGVKPRGSSRGWWPSSVAVVVKRLQPQPARRASRGYPAGGSDFILARLLRCPTCGTRLTGVRDREGHRVRYACRLGSVQPHPRTTITESRILDAVRTEVAHLVTPSEVDAVVDDQARRADLDGRRLRILDMFEAGHIDRAEREKRLARVAEALESLDARQVVLEVPTIDWGWGPRELNRVLRALFEEVDLDPATFQPVGYRWLVPEWRQPTAAEVESAA